MIISMSEGYHKFECGLPDIYGTILDKMTALSQGKMNPGDTKDYSRLALRAITRYPLAWHYKQKEIKEFDTHQTFLLTNQKLIETDTQYCR